MLNDTDWTIRVRLTKLGTIRKFARGKRGGEGQLLPLEFIDQYGTEIAGTLFDEAIVKYQPILIEGKCYLVSQGKIKPANKRYTSLPNEYSITLNPTSEIVPLTEGIMVSAPELPSNYTSLERVSSLPNGTLVDVMGAVKSVGESIPLILKDGVETCKRSIMIFDDVGNTIEVILWKQFADIEIMENQVLGLKAMRVSEFEKKQLNTVADSTILLNPIDERANKIREW